MNANTALWQRAFTTDPAAVKPITGKQYKGNSPKPYWIVQRLTEEFGPCGIGWGFTILGERFERFGEHESLHVAIVRLWYVMRDDRGSMDGKRGEFEQVGQTRASYMSAGGKFIVDEDAPKKSVTDALVKCASYLGFAGDIFSGMWDDSKYVQQAAQHYAGQEEAKQAAQMRAAWLEEQAAKLTDCKTAEDLQSVWKAAFRVMKQENDDDAIATLTPIKDRAKAALEAA